MPSVIPEEIDDDAPNEIFDALQRLQQNQGFSRSVTTVDVHQHHNRTENATNNDDSLFGYEEELSEMGQTTSNKGKKKKKKKKVGQEGLTEDGSQNSSKLSGLKRKTRKIKVLAL